MNKGFGLVVPVKASYVSQSLHGKEAVHPGTLGVVGLGGRGGLWLSESVIALQRFQLGKALGVFH